MVNYALIYNKIGRCWIFKQTNLTLYPLNQYPKYTRLVPAHLKPAYTH